LDLSSEFGKTLLQIPECRMRSELRHLQMAAPIHDTPFTRSLIGFFVA
jgi:hypothetical protein